MQSSKTSKKQKVTQREILQLKKKYTAFTEYRKYLLDKYSLESNYIRGLLKEPTKNNSK